MICRLCLDDSPKPYLTIFGKNSGIVDTEIAKMIIKYLQVELMYNDRISNKICQSCWHQLRDFNAFVCMIDQKQEELKQQLCVKENYNVLREQHQDLEAKCLLNEEAKYLKVAIESVNIISSSTSEPQIDINTEDPFVVETPEIIVPDVNNENQLQVFSKVSIKRKKTASTKLKSNTKSIKRLPALKMHKLQGDEIKKLENSAKIRDLDAYIAKHAKMSCSMCNQPLQDFNQLKKHFRREHKCVGYVVCCNSRFRKRTLYVDHLKLHENPEHFKCAQCNKVLASRNCYYTHMASMHPTEDELVFQCDMCPRKFAKQFIMDYHKISSHRHRDVASICEECNKSFCSIAALKAHHKRVHLNSTIIICDICGKNFRTKKSFEAHQATVHQGIKLPKAQCKVCQAWISARSLYMHMYKHQDEESGKEFICPTCGVAKQTRHKLSSHIRYHHSGKTFNCTLCMKVFKKSRSLEEHMATHTGQDLYTCQFCAQTFKSSSNMYNHRKKMHPDKWESKCS